MRVCFIAPTSAEFMPFLNNYLELFNNDIDYDIIEWDRMKLRESSSFVFHDQKKQHKRNFFDYIKYSKYVKKVLKNEKYDYYIVLGIQMAFFIRSFLLKKGNYIIDVRDDHILMRYPKMNKVLKKANLVVVSSPEYKAFLPKNIKLIVNHNTKIQSFAEINADSLNFNKNNIKISSIGATRDYDANIFFINQFKNNSNVEIIFNGYGDINKQIEDYVLKNDINNVHLTGLYKKAEEPALYEKADLINVVRFADSINNITALPNKLYAAAIYGKPMIGLTGTYLGDLIIQYNLGLIVSKNDSMENALSEYIKRFNDKEYIEGRKNFLNTVLRENDIFKTEVLNLLSSNEKGTTRSHGI